MCLDLCKMTDKESIFFSVPLHRSDSLSVLSACLLFTVTLKPDPSSAGLLFASVYKTDFIQVG